MSVFPAAGDEQRTLSQELARQKTEELMELLSTTLTSLSCDAAAVRQLSSLATLTGIQTNHNHDPNNSSSIPPNWNDDDNDNNNRQQTPTSLAPLKQLAALDKWVFQMEEKVSALRQIVVEEKRALLHFEHVLKAEAAEQAKVLDQMSQALSLQQQPRTSSTSSSNSRVLQSRSVNANNNNNNNSATTITPNNKPLTTSAAIRRDHASSTPSSSSSSTPSSGSKRRDSVDPRTQPPPRQSSHESGGGDWQEVRDMPSHEHQEEEDADNNNNNHNNLAFKRVTRQELQEKTQHLVGGRISLLDLNDALGEIERVCHDNNQLAQLPQSSSISGPQQRKYDYLKQQRASQNRTDVETQVHEGQHWVSEQELREHCAFFRHGESTARATLTLLCSLRRLKQVPGKHRQVTYLCHFVVDDNNNHNNA